MSKKKRKLLGAHNATETLGRDLAGEGKGRETRKESSLKMRDRERMRQWLPAQPCLTCLSLSRGRRTRGGSVSAKTTSPTEPMKGVQGLKADGTLTIIQEEGPRSRSPTFPYQIRVSRASTELLWPASPTALTPSPGGAPARGTEGVQPPSLLRHC